jgi:hypothetical protein
MFSPFDRSIVDVDFIRYLERLSIILEVATSLE